MILLDKPYLSPFMKASILKNRFRVLKTPEAMELLGEYSNYVEPEVFFNSPGNEAVYSNSENAISLLSGKPKFGELYEKINLFKNKALFRKMLSPLYPDFFYQEIPLEDLGKINPENLPFPLILKPAVGFFSLGVYPVSGPEEWNRIMDTLHHDIDQFKGVYPEAVLSASHFILEQVIHGEEFALDVYYDDTGKPVVLNILHHLFSSAQDVSDRVYVTSIEIVKQYRETFMPFLLEMGELSGIHNFPVHIELRMDSAGKIIPIEANPLRFAGWCTTDIAGHAFGIDVYDCYLNNKKPDWERIFNRKDKKDKLYSLIVVEKPSAYPTRSIESFDYQGLISQFEKTLEYRKIDFRDYPVFAFIFTETRKENQEELERILKSDLKEWIQFRE